MMKFTYLTQSDIKLFDHGTTTIVPSLFLNQYKQNLNQIERKKEWKRNTDLNAGGFSFNSSEDSSSDLGHQFKGVTFFEGEILYSLQVQNVSGMFRADPKGEAKFEGRLVHSNTESFGSLQFNPRSRYVVYSKVKDSPQEHLFIQHMDTEFTKQITEGDCIDQFPTWDKKDFTRVNYQSKGIGRDHNGFVGAYSATSLFSYDLQNDLVEEIASNPEYDYLLPNSLNGEFFYLRKPHFVPLKKTNTLLHLLKLPGQLLTLVFHWVNFKNMMYTGKPLHPQNGFAKSLQQPEKLFIHGNLVNAQEVIAHAEKEGNSAPSLVPKDWKLIKRTKSGTEETLVEGVIAYDINHEGDILYSTGTGVYLLDHKGDKKQVLKDQFVSQLQWAPQ